jgi:hypothetical protein
MHMLFQRQDLVMDGIDNSIGRGVIQRWYHVHQANTLVTPLRIFARWIDNQEINFLIPILFRFNRFIIHVVQNIIMINFPRFPG